MKLPKYNLCYDTRDVIKSLAGNANDRNDFKVAKGKVTKGANVLFPGSQTVE